MLTKLGQAFTAVGLNCGDFMNLQHKLGKLSVQSFFWLFTPGMVNDFKVRNHHKLVLMCEILRYRKAQLVKSGTDFCRVWGLSSVISHLTSLTRASNSL